MLEDQRSQTELLNEIEILRRKLEQLERDKIDLEIALETTTEHGDTIEQELFETNEKLQAEITERHKAQAALQTILETVTRDNQDLQIMLDTTSAHGDSVEYQLYNQAVEFMRRSEEQFRAIAEATPIVMMISHMFNGIITYANSTSIKTLSADNESLYSCKLQDFFYDPTDEQKLLDIYTVKGYVQNYEMKVKKSNGEVIWVTASLHPLSLMGEATFLTTFYDITERKQVEFALQISESQLRQQAEELELRVEQRTSELKKANRAKSEFLANMSHELRTPLNAILGFTQLMIGDDSLSFEYQEALGIIRNSSEHLLSLINNILEMSKIEAGKITLNEANFDLGSLLDRLRNMLRLKAESKNIYLIFDLAPDVPRYIQTDEVKLSQILINLLNNALKFTQSGGVTLRIRKLPSDSKDRSLTHLVFEIEDTGIGIAEADLNSIFEAFVQTDSGLKSQEGTGLGLSISRRFVQLMGGDIRVKSYLEKGAVFDFDILAKLDSEPAKLEVQESIASVVINTNYVSNQVEQTQAETYKGNPLRILLAEDNLVNQKVAVKMINKLGYPTDIAVNGVEVLEALQRQSYDLIFMDIQMPIMDGIEATRLIYETCEESNRPIIVALTANTMPEERDRCFAAGMSHHLSKPVRLEELKAILEECQNRLNTNSKSIFA